MGALWTPLEMRVCRPEPRSQALDSHARSGKGVPNQIVSAPAGAQTPHLGTLGIAYSEAAP